MYTSVSVCKVPLSPSEYVVKRIVEDGGYGWNKYYIIRWYGYGPEEDSIEPAKNISQHVVTRYYRQGNHRKAVLKQTF